MKQLQTGECERNGRCALIHCSVLPFVVILSWAENCVTLQILLVLRSTVGALGHCAFVHCWILLLVVIPVWTDKFCWCYAVDSHS